MQNMVVKRITGKNIKRILEAWPQAIDADGGDLRNLHDIANAGAQGWAEKLYWPDYLWLGLENSGHSDRYDGHFQQRLLIESPNRQDGADFGIIDKIPIRPISGQYQLSGNIDCIIELKTISVDHAPKFSRLKPDEEWPKFLRNKLRNAFTSQLEHADNQIRDGKRLIGLSESRGVTILVNEHSPSLVPDTVSAFLAHSIHRLNNTDAIVYLSDRPQKFALNIINKNLEDSVVHRFSTEFASMLQCVQWGNHGPILPSNPKFTIRIEMDEKSRAMTETWSTGWRIANDPSPVSVPSIALSIVQVDEFKSGLK